MLPPMELTMFVTSERRYASLIRLRVKDMPLDKVTV